MKSKCYNVTYHCCLWWAILGASTLKHWWNWIAIGYCYAFLSRIRPIRITFFNEGRWFNSLIISFYVENERWILIAKIQYLATMQSRCSIFLIQWSNIVICETRKTFFHMKHEVNWCNFVHHCLDYLIGSYLLWLKTMYISLLICMLRPSSKSQRYPGLIITVWLPFFH